MTLIGVDYPSSYTNDLYSGSYNFSVFIIGKSSSPIFVNEAANRHSLSTQWMLSISFLCNISFKAQMSILKRLSETYFWDRNASWSDLLFAYILSGCYLLENEVPLIKQTSIIAIVSAAKVFRTMRLIRLTCQLIRLHLLSFFTGNITCPPWLPPSLRFPKAASVKKLF